MIIVKLKGGLGNQLFQYAFGRRLAYERNVPLKLDLSWFPTQADRSYKLDRFNIQARPLSVLENKLYNGKGRLPYYYRRLRSKLPSSLQLKRLKETTDKFFENYTYIVGKEGTLHIIGDWQSEKYFKPIETVIRRELSLSQPLREPSQLFADRIQATNSVSLHIRRGDYAENPETRAYHGLLPLEYYFRAVECIAEQVKAPHFFVFSDDLKWAKDNLCFDYTITLVDANDAETDFEDLQLMSLCRHHIIANSSFSWWGAWLADYPQKQVIAPKLWFADPSRDTRDRVPEEWIRL